MTLAKQCGLECWASIVNPSHAHNAFKFGAVFSQGPLQKAVHGEHKEQWQYFAHYFGVLLRSYRMKKHIAAIVLVDKSLVV